MRQDNNETAGNMISMEEYLKKRQALRSQETEKRAELSGENASALKLAEILMV